MPTTLEINDVSLTFFRSFSAGTYVFRNKSELVGAWNAAPFQVYPIGIVTEEPVMPDYDFTKFTVIGLSQGIGKWCFKPNITSVVASGQTSFVHYSIPTASTLACMRDGPLISFVLVPTKQSKVTFVQNVN